MAITARSVGESCVAAKRASRVLAGASSAEKDAALGAIVRLLGERVEEILEANAADLADERAVGLTQALRDRLTLTADRVAGFACARRDLTNGQERSHGVMIDGA